MLAHSEVESKWTLARCEYEALVTNCRLIRYIDQLNIYFDSQWMLARIGATCRVRFHPSDHAMFTLKLPTSWSGDGTRRAAEFEMPAHLVFSGRFSVYWRTFDTTCLASPLQQALRSLNVSRLSRVGWMRNARHLLQLPNGGVFELDRFSLPGGEIGYEAEVEEADDDKRNAIVATIRKLVPAASPSRTSKFERFAAAAQALHTTQVKNRAHT